MKSLVLGVVLILLLGIAGFFYRNVMEKDTGPTPLVCTMEAKMCPDGSSVGRSGASCEFSPCALPNAEDAEIGIGFVIPAGYVANPDAIGPDLTLRAVFDKVNGTSGIPHNIVIRSYRIEAGKTANDVILENTMFEPSGMMADSMDDFDPVIINGRTFQSAVLERFEAQVHSVYYLARNVDVLKFEVIERDVVDWMEPTLSVPSLPEHAAFLSMLATLNSQ